MFTVHIGAAQQTTNLASGHGRADSAHVGIDSIPAGGAVTQIGTCHQVGNGTTLNAAIRAANAD